jgi:phosphinothricin acetyltransferase
MGDTASSGRRKSLPSAQWTRIHSVREIDVKIANEIKKTVGRRREVERLDGLTVRGAKASDLEALTSLYNHYIESSPATSDTEAKSLDDRRAWMDHYAPHGRHRLLVALRGDDLLGYTTSSVFRPKDAYATSVETTVYISAEAMGQGVGSALYTELLTQLRDEPVHRIVAGITLPNPASQALHRKFGFEPLGLFHEVGRKFDRYWSVQWFQKHME